MKKKYLEAGKIVSVHGIRGEVKIVSYCDSPGLLCGLNRLFLGKDHTEVTVERSRVHKGMVISKLSGIDTPEQAEQLRDTVLYMDRDDIKLGDRTYFIQDLIGITVRDADTDLVYGKITDVMQTGANDVYVVNGNGREYLVPAIADVVTETDIENNTMLIRPLDGLFD